MNIGIIYVILTAVLFATFEPVSKLIAGDVTPYAITFWRFFIGSLLLAVPAAAKIKKEKIRLSAKDVTHMTALGVLFICVSMTLLQIAIKKADNPSLIAIIFSSNSVFTILLAAVFMENEHFTKSKIIALIFGAMGIVLCADFSKGTNMESVILSILSAFTFSLYTVLNQRYAKKHGALIQSSGVFLFGSIVLFVILLITGIDISPSFEMAKLSLLIYIGLFVTGIGYCAYFAAIEKGGAIMASLAFFIKPILTPFVALTINNIVPDSKTYIAILCIVTASYFATYKKAKTA